MDKELKKLYEMVYLRDGWRCRHCRNTFGLHPHHVIYQSHQGPDVMNNIITLCWVCHRAVHDGKLRIDIIKTLTNDIDVKFTRLKNWKPQ